MLTPVKTKMYSSYRCILNSTMCTNSNPVFGIFFILFYMKEEIILTIFHQQFFLSWHWGLCLNTFIYLYFFHFNHLRFQHFNLISLKNSQMINVATKKKYKKTKKLEWKKILFFVRMLLPQLSYRALKA